MSGFKRSMLTFGITFCISLLIFGIVAYIIASIFFNPGEAEDNEESQLCNIRSEYVISDTFYSI